MTEQTQEPLTDRAIVRLPKTIKRKIREYQKLNGLRYESGYIMLALKNQIHADEQKFSSNPKNLIP